MNRLELQAGARIRPGSRTLQKRALYLTRLTGPLEQLHLAVDGVSVLQRCLAVDLPEPQGFSESRFVSVVDVAWPRDAAEALRRLTGHLERDPAWDHLDPGRLPLYVCPECADLFCGSLTVAVDRFVDPHTSEGVVRWSNLRYEDGQTPAADLPDLSAVGSFTFDAVQYESVVEATALHLEKQAQEDARTEELWLAQRRPMARLRRWNPGRRG